MGKGNKKCAVIQAQIKKLKDEARAVSGGAYSPKPINLLSEWRKKWQIVEAHCRKCIPCGKYYNSRQEDDNLSVSLTAETA